MEAQYKQTSIFRHAVLYMDYIENRISDFIENEVEIVGDTEAERHAEIREYGMLLK